MGPGLGGPAPPPFMGATPAAVPLRAAAAPLVCPKPKQKLKTFNWDKLPKVNSKWRTLILSMFNMIESGCQWHFRVNWCDTKNIFGFRILLMSNKKKKKFEFGLNLISNERGFGVESNREQAAG